MEKNILSFKGGGSKATISMEIKKGNSERFSYESCKIKYINGKQSGVTDVGISGVSDNTDYLLEIDEGNHLIQITARGDNTSGTCTFTQDESGDQYLIHCTTPTTKITNNITINVYKSGPETRAHETQTQGHCVLLSDQPVATDITFKLQIQYGVSSDDQREYTCTLFKGKRFSENLFAIRQEAEPQLIDYSYSPQSDSQYIYTVTVL